MRDLASGLFNGRSLDPIREIERHVLLKKALLIDSIRKALKHERAILDVRNHKVCDTLVVIDDLLLANSIVRKQYLIRSSKLDRV